MIMLSLVEAAKKQNITRQGCYVAIKKKRLKAEFKDFRWQIRPEDIEAYVQSKYKKEHSTRNGKILFDKSKGLYSVKEVADIVGKAPQFIYHQLRKDRILGIRKGATWIIQASEIEKLKKYIAEKPHSLPRIRMG